MSNTTPPSSSKSEPESMPASKRVDFSRRPRRSRIEARILDAGAPSLRRGWRKVMSEAFATMSGTVVEIGPGTGVNLDLYPRGVRVIAIEPNPHMHERLRTQAERHGVDLEIRTTRGEQIDLDDGVADAVVATLVLCGVEQPTQVVGEIHRILKPGGTYLFVEHVVAPPSTWTRRLQRVIKRPHRWMFNGCEVDRDTASVLSDAGFDDLVLYRRDAGATAGYVRHQIAGTATR